MSSGDRTTEDMKKKFSRRNWKIRKSNKIYKFEDNLKTLKKDFIDKWKHLARKLI